MISFWLLADSFSPHVTKYAAHDAHRSPLRDAETMLSEPEVGSSAADTTPEKSMIVEMRTYTLQPGTVAQFEERFGAALAVRAKLLSPLAAFWHTEVGPLALHHLLLTHLHPYCCPDLTFAGGDGREILAQAKRLWRDYKPVSTHPTDYRPPLSSGLVKRPRR
jgi:hypothetical protein